MSTFGAAATANPNRSAEVVQPPTDSISSLCFSPKANFLVATSWDNQVRCWEVMRSGTTFNTMAKIAISHDQPVLCSAWKDDGTTVFSGGCDKQVKMWPLLSGGQPVQVAMHDAPVKEMAWIPEMNLLVTGSWDKTLRYWDLRQSNPAHVQQLPERCYALTVRHPLMVAGTADRNLIVFNLQNPQTEFKRVNSPLKYQTRCLAAFPDQQGFLVGSIEGRVGVHHLDDAQQSKNFTFKCHREANEIYAVNSLNFHPVHHTFSTSGSDGTFNFWDKDSKQRLKLRTLGTKKLEMKSPYAFTESTCLIMGDETLMPLHLHDCYLSVRRLWQGAVNPSPAVHSTMMDQYLHIRFVMTGARVQKITTQQQQRRTYIYTCRRILKLKASHESPREESDAASHDER